MLIAVLTLMGVCACSPKSHQLVGATEFCVPSGQVIEATGWLANATRHLPNDGFAFVTTAEQIGAAQGYIPALNIKGEPMNLSGSLSTQQRGEWIERLPSSHRWRQLAEGPKAIWSTDSAASQIFAYESPQRDRWVVWEIAQGAELSPSSIEKAGTFIAMCHATDFRGIATRKVDLTTTCNRTVHRAGMSLSYTFGGANLSSVPKLDGLVWSTVLSWRCNAT